MGKARTAKVTVYFDSDIKSVWSVVTNNNIVKMGIPEENSMGVSTGEIRKLAKKLGVSQSLANELWETGYHEAKLLSVLITDISMIDFTYIDRLILVGH